MQSTSRNLGIDDVDRRVSIGGNGSNFSAMLIPFPFRNIQDALASLVTLTSRAAKQSPVIQPDPFRERCNLVAPPRLQSRGFQSACQNRPMPRRSRMLLF